MSPEVRAMHIPDSLHLERHPTPYVSSDEPLMVRDADGHVYAVVDAPPESLYPTAN